MVDGGKFCYGKVLRSSQTTQKWKIHTVQIWQSFKSRLVDGTEMFIKNAADN